uniref:Epimerase domain-containing protein n=1 Tax=Caenorhabditis tropicalis TaxID=1561998 RepID=A0A1I7TDJ7_9PELO
MEEPPGRHKWGVLENKWRFFQPLYFNPTSNYLLEFLIFIHIYILAALLAIREALFDSRNKAKIVKFLLQNSEIECHVTVHHKSARLKSEGNLTFYELDLTNQAQILLLAHQLKSHRFDVAFFAPGIMLSPENRTSDGVELHNAVNVVGQAMLYELIQNECKRAIFLSSATARVACYSKDPNFLSVYAGPYQAYASSKLNLAVYVKEVAKDRQVTAVSLHPGTVPGHLYKNANYLVRYLNATLLPKLMRSPEMAALVVLHTIFRDDIQPGAYYEDMETVNVADWVPEEERTRIYETIHRRIDLWMEK